MSIATILIFQSCSREEKNVVGQPNIILILADDMGFSDPGCFGGEIRTPNLDMLAEGGIRMTQLYNSARCCPSRASLLTGLYPHQAGIGWFANSDKGSPGYRGALQDRCVTIAEVLKLAGYATYMSGKWHVGKNPGPIKRGFDEFYGFTVPYSIDCWDPESMFRLPEGRPVRKYENGKFYSTRVITDYALDFLKSARKKNKPYFLYLAYNAPHFPLQAPEEITDRYYGIYLNGWDSIRQARFARMKQLGIFPDDPELPPRSMVPETDEGWDNGWADKRNPAWKSLDGDRRKDLARRMAIYAAMVDIEDREIGRIITDLKDNGEFNNSLIFFLSDNGACAEWNPFGFDNESGPVNILHTGEDLKKMGLPGSYLSYGSAWANLCNTPLRMYKHYTYEGGISTPFIIHWPAETVNNGRIDNRPAHIVDIMATCVDVAGAGYPEEYNGNKIIPMEGKSLVPVMLDEKTPERGIGFEHERNRGYRQGDWKIVSTHYKKDKWELYNIKNDRFEQHDLAADYPDKLNEMINRYESWAKRCMVYPLPNIKN